MKFLYINPEDDLSSVTKVLNQSHATIAVEFGFTRETNPANNAFIDEQILQDQLEKGIELYQLMFNEKPTGCIAIEKSLKERNTFYIEKVSVIPEYRHLGLGSKLLEFAESRIRENGGEVISISLIDSNIILKQWYSMRGYIETGTKDFSHLPFRVCFMSKKLDA